MHVLEPAWESLKRDFDSACSQAASAARSRLAHDLNQTSRRLRQYETEAEWYSALVDGASRFAKSVAVFRVAGADAQLGTHFGLEVPPELNFPVNTAGAFASAVETKDPVVALRTPGEVTPALAVEDPAARAHLFPVVNSGRVVAILFAAGDQSLDVDALELIGTMAAAVLERQANRSLHSQISALPAPASAPAPDRKAPEVKAPPAASPGRPPWSQLTREQRALHVQAQRFSRVAVAEMQLARPEACRAGREQNNVYVFLKAEIDKARETYRRQFMTHSPMVDYLHLELVGTAAAGDEEKLGADYPGQLL